MFRQPDLTPDPIALDFRCETIDRGTSMLGVVIGPMVTVRTHAMRKMSKPCLAFASEGKLRCWCQERWCAPRDVAYLPVINRDGEKLVVLLSKIAALTIKNVKEGMLLKFTRPDKPKVRIHVMAVTGSDQEQLWVTQARKVKGTAIMEYLCHIWQIHSLTKHLGFTVRQPQRVNPDAVLDPNTTETRAVSWVDKVLSEDATDAEAA